MKTHWHWIMPAIGLLMVGCSHVAQPFKDSHPELIETQPQLVSGCDMLGMIAETADADQISSCLARRQMLNRVKARAVELGATHLVWLHQTNESAAAKAFRCKADAGKE